MFRSLRAVVFAMAAFAGLVMSSHSRGGATPQEQPAAGAEPAVLSREVITAEANLVLVDVIVTDKKGNYIRDLEAADFRVFEDEKEQEVASFSRVAEAAKDDEPRYLVLFFDNSTMSTDEQSRARAAARKFVEKYASNDRMMAIVDFTGAFQVAQNFTSDPELLQRATSNIKFAALRPNEPGQPVELASRLGAPSAVQVRSDFAARSVLLAVRHLARTLRPVPGRKTMIFFSGGFPLNPERQSELSATIDAANKANMAIYPVDVRGLSGLQTDQPGFDDPGRQSPFPNIGPGSAVDPSSVFPHERELLASLSAVLIPKTRLAQRPGGGGGSGGPPSGGGGRPGGGGGGTAPSPGGGGGTAPSPGGGAAPGGASPGGGTFGGGGPGGRPSGIPTGPGDRNIFGQPGGGLYPPRPIIPPLMDNVTSNQQVLQALASGTGGFTIFNTNDFLEGLEKIALELDEYYLIGYIPPNAVQDGSYHRIDVKVQRKGLRVRHRVGYYDVKSQDLLAGKPEGKVLEERAASPEPGEIPVSLSAMHFYTSPNVARVNLAIEIPAKSLQFDKKKGKFQSAVHVLGIATRPDGTVAARFSDTVKLELDRGGMKEFSEGPFQYRNAFNIAPGQYALKVVMGAGGQKFGKFEQPLNVEPYSGEEFHLSGVALSNQMQPVSELVAGLDLALMEERTPLVSGGVELIPSPSLTFKRDEKVGMYLEVYEPSLLEDTPPRVGIIYDVVDANTDKRVYTSNTILINSFAQPGSPVIPVGLFLPVEKLQAGEYRLLVQGRDSAGKTTIQRSAEFAIQ